HKSYTLKGALGDPSATSPISSPGSFDNSQSLAGPSRIQKPPSDKKRTYNEIRATALAKRRKGEDLTEREQELISKIDAANAKTNAKKNAERSEVREKRREGKKLTKREKELISKIDAENAKQSA